MLRLVGCLLLAWFTGIAALPQAPVDPTKLRIVEGRGGLDPETGFIKIAGEIHNETGHWIQDPRISVELLDAAGRPLGVTSIMTETAKDLGEQGALDSVYASRSFVPPGEVAVFQYVRDARKLAGTYASHRLSATARSIAGGPRVVIEGFSATKGGDGWYSASGRIKNVGASGCRSPRAVIGIYGGDGKLLGVAEEDAEGFFQKTLQSGESAGFNWKSIEYAGAAADAKAWADCRPTS